MKLNRKIWISYVFCYLHNTNCEIISNVSEQRYYRWGDQNLKTKLI